MHLKAMLTPHSFAPSMCTNDPPTKDDRFLSKCSDMLLPVPIYSCVWFLKQFFQLTLYSLHSSFLAAVLLSCLFSVISAFFGFVVAVVPVLQSEVCGWVLLTISSKLPLPVPSKIHKWQFLPVVLMPSFTHAEQCGDGFAFLWQVCQWFLSCSWICTNFT